MELSGHRKDYRIVVRVKNNRMLRHIEDAGYGSIAAFSRAFGLNHQWVGELINMKRPAQKNNGEWSALAMHISDALAVNPEDLFNERQAAADFDRVSGVIEFDEPTIVGLDDRAALSIEAPSAAVNEEMRDLLAKGMEVLSPRYRDVLSARYGLNGEPERTLDEVASDIGVHRERVRQIEQVAIRRVMGRIRGSRLAPGGMRAHE